MPLKHETIVWGQSNPQTQILATPLTDSAINPFTDRFCHNKSCSQVDALPRETPHCTVDALPRETPHCTVSPPPLNPQLVLAMARVNGQGGVLTQGQLRDRYLPSPPHPQAVKAFGGWAAHAVVIALHHITGSRNEEILY
ncbi:hypothetical protein J6590_066199 [Homalodisca vitripennis]|nr:hypothetical protein J6590_066199 [Homalodisca vitripennis]